VFEFLSRKNVGRRRAHRQGEKRGQCGHDDAVEQALGKVGSGEQTLIVAQAWFEDPGGRKFEGFHMALHG
jgi:hypothetical protein